MYEAQTEKDWRYIITDSNSKLIIAANEAIYQKVTIFHASTVVP
jgi:long-subunit acyl-CoA synthetase (AMP-forming)